MIIGGEVGAMGLGASLGFGFGFRDVAEAAETVLEEVCEDLPAGCLLTVNLVDVFPALEGFCFGLVDGLIGFVALVVLDGVLDGGNQDDCPNGHHSEPRIGGAKDGEHLEDNEEEEVQVGDAAELLKEVFGQEAEDGVFCRLDFVGRVPHQRLPVLIQFGRGDLLVHVHTTPNAWGRLRRG
ncbi:hypothetical protein BC938DRAFT_477821 [Jimgerdemannia flammicorona]|uniref:Uncharacterized protein n=1 Tax=Jimgerdemannia flammicorona TaxID=994334 RepID=A0A433P7M8_9FUNG|nr:hypothetical protein BC938DRAFT_477821 [Jimgerdemannia flammicorona]